MCTLKQAGVLPLQKILPADPEVPSRTILAPRPSQSRAGFNFFEAELFLGHLAR